MKIHEHFLEQDLKQASMHYSCFQDCLIAVNDHVESGEVELAKHRATDMLLSLQVLSNLSFEKHRMDNLKFLMDEMVQHGIDMQTVRRHFGRVD